jgi:galactokinase
VISELEASPTEADARLEPLRAAAVAGRGALLAGDLAALGTAMLDSTDAQERLHPELVSDTARAVFSVARRHGALGWKVNGAGGEGGSVTVLCGDGDRHRLVEEIHAIGGRCSLRYAVTSAGRAGRLLAMAYSAKPTSGANTYETPTSGACHVKPRRLRSCVVRTASRTANATFTP